MDPHEPWSTYTEVEWRDRAARFYRTREWNVTSSFTTYGHPGLELAEAFARTVDHTLLKPDADEAEVIGTVCVRPHFVSLAYRELQGSDVDVCSVVCFPEGTQSTEDKISEGTLAMHAGAKELDFVLDRSLLREGDLLHLLVQLQDIRCAFPSRRLCIKLILETSQLTDEQIVLSTLLAGEAGWDFVKTSTGFLGAGATGTHVRWMRVVAQEVIDQRDTQGMQARDRHGRPYPPSMGVKASGGIRTALSAEYMLAAGATRLGLSGSVAIVEEGRGQAPRQVNGDTY